jgi:hypothetical protein
MMDIVKARIGQTTQAAADRVLRANTWKSIQTITPETKILAHGDSWFDYPWILGTGGGVPEHLSDILGVHILNIAHHGDSTETMLGVEKRKQIEEHLPGMDVLLFSGGGNDIAGEQFCLWLNDNKGDVSAAIDWPRLNQVLDLIVADYRDLIEIRDRLAPECLLVTHAYDWPIPDEHGVCGLGPWLLPSLLYCGWDCPSDQYNIVKSVMTAFCARLSSLADEQSSLGKKHIHVFTQGTLTDNDWANEIHPNRQGFEKIAQKFAAALKQ